MLSTSINFNWMCTYGKCWHWRHNFMFTLSASLFMVLFIFPFLSLGFPITFFACSFCFSPSCESEWMRIPLPLGLHFSILFTCKANKISCLFQRAYDDTSSMVENYRWDKRSVRTLSANHHILHAHNCLPIACVFVFYSCGVIHSNLFST